MALNPREDPLAQVTVPCNNPTSYLTGIGFAQSLMPRQVVVIATLAEMAYRIPLSY